MASKTLAVVVFATAASLTSYAFAAEGTSSAAEWKSPQVVGQPGYKEEPVKRTEAAAPRAVRQDPYGAKNPNQQTQKQ